MLIVPANLSIVADEALLAELELILPAARGWPAGYGAPLARWAAPSAEIPEPLSQIARLIEELARRGGDSKLTAELRERFLVVYDEFEKLLPEAARFFESLRKPIARMRARSKMLGKLAKLRADRRAKALLRANIDVHPDDLPALREFANALLKKRGIEPVMGQRRPGRPKKTSAGQTQTPSVAQDPASAEPVPLQAPAAAPSATPASKPRPTKEDFEKFF